MLFQSSYPLFVGTVCSWWLWCCLNVHCQCDAFITRKLSTYRHQQVVVGLKSGASSSSLFSSTPTGSSATTNNEDSVSSLLSLEDDADDYPVLLSDGGDTDSAAATLRSMTFSNLEKSQEPQLLCDFLMELGACSTSITDADRDTSREEAIFSEPGDDPWHHLEQQYSADSAPAAICGDHAVGRNVWNRCNVQAQFPNSVDLEWIAEVAQESLDIKLQPYAVEPVPNRDWVVHVQQSWKPILVSGIILRFPWHTDQDVQEIVQAGLGANNDGDGRRDRISSDIVELQLEGGAAFGTGEHPTTQLCLTWIQETIQNHPIRKLMDYGAGSGVLGMAACAFTKKKKSGDDSTITIEAIGVDIDIDAVRIANANAQTNSVSMENYLPPLIETSDSESKSVLMKAHVYSESHEILPDAYNGPIYDACVANILAGPLVTLAPTLARLTKAGGKLGLSGILAPQADTVVEAYERFFDNVVVENQLNGWVLISGTRKT